MMSDLDVQSDLALLFQILQNPLQIVLENLGRMCLEIESIPAIRRASRERRLPAMDGIRATILLHRPGHNDFVITPMRMVGDVLARPSKLHSAGFRGILRHVWKSAGGQGRTASAVSFPPFTSSNASRYYLEWERIGVPRAVAERYTRKGRFYFYIALIRNKKPFGILVIDANVPIGRAATMKLADVVDHHIGSIEACFNDTINLTYRDRHA